MNFAGPLTQLYRHSSEILHGTYFGVVYFWTGGNERPQNRADAEWILLTSHLVSVISAAIIAIRGVIEVIERHYGIAGLHKENAEILSLMTEYVEQHLVGLTQEQLK